MDSPTASVSEIPCQSASAVSFRPLNDDMFRRSAIDYWLVSPFMTMLTTRSGQSFEIASPVR